MVASLAAGMASILFSSRMRQPVLVIVVASIISVIGEVSAASVSADNATRLRRTGADVMARPMAGTGPRADELVRSDKDRREHRLVRHQRLRER